MPLNTYPESQRAINFPAANAEIVSLERLSSPGVSSAGKYHWQQRALYQPDHQVELLHLQAEVDALLLKLQNAGSKPMSAKPSVCPLE